VNPLLLPGSFPPAGRRVSMSESDPVLLPDLVEFVSAVGANRDEMLDPPWNAPRVPRS
jgi:hypothetical protein